MTTPMMVMQAFTVNTSPFIFSSSSSFSRFPSVSSLPPNQTKKRVTTGPTNTSHINPSSSSKVLHKPQPSSATTRKSAVLALKESTDLLPDLSRYEDVLLVQDLNIVLRHFGNSRRWREVSQLFDWMKQYGKVNVASYSGFFKYMGKSKNPVRALQVYNRLTDKSARSDVSICNAILGCLIKDGKIDSGMKLFEQMKKDGLQPDLVTYSTLLIGCTKMKGGYSRAMQLINELVNNGLCMDDVIYGTLLAICASNNLRQEAELFFEQMKAEGLIPNQYHYGSLMNLYSIDGDYAKAENLLKDMKSSGLEPNKVILTTLLKVYVRGGLLDKSKELLAELEALGYAEEEMPYCLLMDNLAKAGRVEEAKVIFDDMIRKNVKSDGYCYSIMISAFCRSRLLEEAKQLAMDFEAKYDTYDLVMLNTLLRAYCNTGNMESAMQMLKKMDGLAISPDWNTFHILVKYFCREKLYHMAYRTIEDMHNKGHQLDEELCCSLIVQLSHNGAAAEAFSVYNMLRYSKRTVRKSLHEKMLIILVGAGLLKDAYVVMKDNTEHISDHILRKFALSFMKLGNINMINDVLKAFNRADRKIDQEVFATAISRYIAKPEKKELLFQLLQWMSGHGYVVDSSSKNLLRNNSYLFGQKHISSEILSSKRDAVHAKLTKVTLHKSKR